MLLGFNLKDKHNPDPNFADYLTDEFKKFEQNYNVLLKEKYPSFTDEMKRVLWLSKKIKISNKTLQEVEEGILNMISSNFKHGKLINFDNCKHISYLKELKTEKIYKIHQISKNSYYYSTLGTNAILSVKFFIKKSKFSKKIIVKYSNGYLAQTAFTYSTLAEVQQRVDAKMQFYTSYKIIGNRIQNYFGTNIKLEKFSWIEQRIQKKVNHNAYMDNFSRSFYVSSMIATTHFIGFEIYLK